MAKERIFDLAETKGAFQLKGKVTGTSKDSFFSDKKTKTNKDMRKVNFGLEYQDGKTLYLSMQGMASDNVYFSKKAENKGVKPEVIKVPWGDRFTFNRKDFKLIGNNIGVKKRVTSDGKTENDKKTLTDFDSCTEIKDNLKDGQSVFTRGKLDYSSFTDDKGNKKMSVKLIPSQVSLCADIDFTDEKFESQSDFNQVIIFMGIEKELDDKEKHTGRFIVAAKIVTYSSIEDVEFIMIDDKLATMFRKNLKPYNAIQVSGRMVSSTPIEKVQDEDSWGESDAMEKVTSANKREFVITGAKPSTIDKELYTQDKVEDALNKIRAAANAESNFGLDNTSADWGSVSSNDNDEDDSW